MTNKASEAQLAASKPKGADRKAYMVADGIGWLAAAAFMIRDGGVPWRNITAVYKLLNVEREEPPILHHDKCIKVKFDAWIKAFK